MFKNLDKYDIRKAMSWVEMPELRKPGAPMARILVKPATEANSPYYNALLKLSGKRIRAMARTDTITAEDSAASRDEDAQLYPLFVIQGWEYLDGEGDDLDEGGFVPYNRPNAQKLCALLNEKAPHLLDRLRNEAATTERFYGEDEIPPPSQDELTELAGN